MSSLFGLDRPTSAGGVWRGVVTKLVDGFPFVEIPRMTRGYEYGPMEQLETVGLLAAGDRVLLGFIEGRQGNLIVLGRIGPGATALQVPPFSMGGALSPVTSGLWYPEANGTVTSLVASLGTVGSTDTVVELLVNGVVVATVTILASAQVADTAIDVDLIGPVTDYVQVRLVTAGTGAKDLTVQVR